MKKLCIIPHILFLIVLSSIVSATLYDTDTALMGWWELDDAGTTMTDSKDNQLPSFDLSSNVSSVEQTALTNYSTYSVTFDGSTESMNNTEITSYLNTMEDITWSVWVSPDYSGDEYAMSAENMGGTESNLALILSDGNVRCLVKSTTQQREASYASTPKGTLITCAYNGSYLYVYENASFKTATTVSGTYLGTADQFMIGNSGLSVSSWFAGGLDEVTIFNRSLTGEEIIELYSNGIQSTVAETATPTFQPPTPADNANNNTNQTMNCTNSGTDVNYFLNVTLTDGDSDMPYVFNQSETGVGHYIFATNFSDGIYNYECFVQNTTNGLFSSSVSRTLTIDTVIPTITIYENTTFETDNSTIISSYLNNLDINISFFDTNLYQTLINITNSSDESSFSILNVSMGGSTTANYSRTIDISTWSVGDYTIKISATDSHTSLSIPDYDVKNGINTLEFNTLEGNRIWISSDGSSYSTLYNKKKDRYEFGWNYLFKDTKRTFTIKAENKISYLPDSEYKGHFVILGSDSMGNWIDFEGIGKDYSVKKINDFEYEIAFVNLPDDNKIISKSLGGLNKEEQHYLLKLGAVIDVWVYDDETGQGLNATATIGSQVNHTIANTTPATLQNITKEITSVTLTASGYGTKAKTIDITANYHNFSFNLTPVSAVKIYFYDEKSEALIIGETFSVYLETVSFANTYSSVVDNPYTILNLISGLYQLKASSENYEEREYLDLNVTNETAVNLNIYLINNTLGSEITFTIVGESLNPLEDVRVVFTKIIGGTRTVIAEEESDFAGQVILDLDDDVEYEINFTKEDYEDKTITLEPKDSEYIITMVSTVGAYNQSVHEGIRYKFEPSNTVLNNNTKYNFTFTLNSTVWEVTNCTLRLLNGSIILSETSSYTSSSCHIRIEQNTFSMTNITSEAIYELASIHEFTVSQQYSVIYTYEGEFSLKNFLDDISDFSMAGFDSFGRMILAFIVIFVILAMASMKISFEHKEVPIFIFWASVGFFSFVGWFTLELNTMPDLFGLKKWFIFYLVSLMCGGFIINKFRK